MSESAPLLDVATALEIVLGQAETLRTETVALAQAAGRILAEAVASDIDSPPYTKALMDGYAVRSSDVGQPTTLTVIEEIAAGYMPQKVVGPGQASRIMTGAPIPDGADGVIPIERTRLDGDAVHVSRAVAAGEHVLPRGREMRVGEVVVPAGTPLTPQAIGLLATVGRADVRVHRTPRVGILATGDELVEAAEKPRAGQIRNSNGPMVVALTARAGATVEYLGIARDDRTSLQRLIAKGLDGTDVLVLAGGVSAGKFDLVPEVLVAAGVTTHFHKIRMKPGRPLLFGTRGSQVIFGLPGNPLSSFVGFELFVRPALRKMMGDPTPGPRFVPVPLDGAFSTNNERPTYAPARLETIDGLRVRPSHWFGSADLRGLLSADALVSVPPGAVDMTAGQLLPTLVLNS
jgi:molybdopterin molybdotransferase